MSSRPLSRQKLGRRQALGLGLAAAATTALPRVAVSQGRKPLRFIPTADLSALDPHRPFVDDVTFPCPQCGQTAARVPEVIDCWYDSGAMPFAQWGFPHKEGSVEHFRETFPADFISEAIDQTRGWFYSLLMISTLVFDEATQKEMGLS